MLYRFRLRSADLERLLQGLFGESILLLALQDAADLVQNRKLIFDRFAIHGLQALYKRKPRGQRRFYLASVFKNASQVNVRRGKIRVEPKAFSKNVHSSGAIAQIGERDCIIKIDGANCKIAAARRNFRFEGVRRPRPESGMVLLQQTTIRIGTRPCGRC